MNRSILAPRPPEASRLPGVGRTGPGPRPDGGHPGRTARGRLPRCHGNRLAQGLGNREIAKALYISEATGKTHLGRIYDKLGVDTRAGAVAVAKERRLLR